MTMNVYLALAMTLGAALEGMELETDPGEPTDRDLYEMTEAEFTELGIRRLPRTLFNAIEALRADTLAERVMGPVMRNSYIEYKTMSGNAITRRSPTGRWKEYLRLY